jgi:hypothetical protein
MEVLLWHIYLDIHMYYCVGVGRRQGKLTTAKPSVEGRRVMKGEAHARGGGGDR